MDPEVVTIIRAITLVLLCLAGIAPSAIDIIRDNRKNR